MINALMPPEEERVELHFNANPPFITAEGVFGHINPELVIDEEKIPHNIQDITGYVFIGRDQRDGREPLMVMFIQVDKKTSRTIPAKRKKSLLCKVFEIYPDRIELQDEKKQHTHEVLPVGFNNKTRIIEAVLGHAYKNARWMHPQAPVSQP
jgi:hypothetical protein